MAVAKVRDERRALVEGVAPGSEAAKLDSGLRRHAADGLAESSLSLRRLHPDRKPQANVELCPTGRHRRPVSCVQSADVEQVRTRHARELRFRVGVQLRLELAQGRDCCEGGLDRVHALVGVRGVA
jgi:hypothetical protein